jgi:hypothetical protein
MTTTPAPSQIATLATDVISQIKADLENGTLPPIERLATFADLHDYVDANEYLINALDNAGTPLLFADEAPDEALEYQNNLCNRTMDFVNVWLAAA